MLTITMDAMILICIQKADIHRYIEQLGLGYTWIDVGWWKQLTVPFPPKVDGGVYATICYQYFGEGKQTFAVTDRRIIGDFTGRIIKDDRTLNKYVFVYEDVVTQEQVWNIAREELTEDSELLDVKRVLVCYPLLPVIRDRCG